MTASASTDEGGECRGEEGEAKEDHGGCVPTIELVPIDLSNWTVIILQIESSRVLVVVEFVHTVEGLGNSSISLQNMIPISTMSSTIQPESVLMDRSVLSQIDDLPGWREDGSDREASSDE